MGIAAEVRQFEGFLPIIDRKLPQEPYIVDGKNVIVNVNGPISALGRAWVFNKAIFEPRGWQTLQNGDETATLHCGGDALLQYDTVSRMLYPVFSHTTRAQFWPWTRAAVGGFIWYCNKEVGLVKHDAVAGTWELKNALSGLPTSPMAICESGGRLVVLGEVAVAWSAIDDGDNLTTSTTTGAGFQLLSKISSSASPVMLLPYAGGFLTYTRAGIMRSELVDSLNPFRHEILSRDHHVLNPWAVQRIGDADLETHVMVTQRGLFATSGDAKPVAWQPAMSEYFNRELIPNIDTDTREAMTFRIDTDFATGWVVVSVSSDSRYSTYDRSWILYVPSNKWGVYSRVHHGFDVIELAGGTTQGRYYGTVNVDGSAFRFSFTDAEFLYPDDTLTTCFVDVIKPGEIPADNWQGLGVHATSAAFTSAMFMTANDLSIVTDAGVYDTKYEANEFSSPNSLNGITVDETPVSGTPTIFTAGATGQVTQIRIVVQPLPDKLAPLMSEITIGPFRYLEESNIDHVGILNEMAISMLDTGLADTFEDWNDFDDGEADEDWNTGSVEEDWGEAAGDSTEYTARWIGTLDGYTTWAADGFTQDVIPAIVAQEGRVRYFSGQCSGTYIFLKISANNVGESFHLRQLKYNMLDAGQVF